MNSTTLLFGDKWNVREKLIKDGHQVFYISNTTAKNCDLVLTTVELSNKQSYDKLLQAVKNLRIKHMIVTSDYFVEIAAWLNGQLNNSFNWLTLEQATISRDKLKLKKFLNENQIKTVRYSELTAHTTYDELTSKVGSSFLIKPRKGVLAQNIECINSSKDFSTWLKDHSAIETYYCEEYLSDIKEFSCDTIVQDGNVIAFFPGEYSVTCLESNKTQKGFGNLFPGSLRREKYLELKKIIESFIKGLNLQTSFCHFEFFLKNNQWYFGEVGCRLPGGYQIPIESHIYQEDLSDLYINLFTKPHIKYTYKDTLNTYKGYYLFPKTPGKIKSIKDNIHFDWVIEKNIFIKQGDILEHEDSSVTMNAAIIFEGESYADLNDKLDLIKKSLIIEYV